ncbi:MAG: GNAT family N-acetyltransferase [Kofleriaceae bacterium]
MVVREMAPHEAPEVLELTRRLWPDSDDTVLAYPGVFVLADAGCLHGFLVMAWRPWVAGCADSPVAFIEGWWVAPELQRRGWGRALVAAAETWASERGACELASDSHADNAGSLAAHRAVGFAEVERTVLFHKPITPRGRRPPNTRIRPDLPGLLAAGALAAREAGVARPTDDQLLALYDRILFQPQPAGKAAWACFELGILLDTELRALVLSHLETLLRGSLVELSSEHLECFDRALFGRPATDVFTAK